MCGIFGIISNKPVLDYIINGLTKLEYRGYDSSGVSILTNHSIETFRAEGKLKNLKKLLKTKKVNGNIGIGHTRWATHGVPSEINAHPHVAKSVAIVHNGIINNFGELKKKLLKKGHIFKSQTDSEVIAHLITDHLEDGLTPEEAVKKTLPILDGAFAIAVLFENYNILIGARRGSPLALGISDENLFLGSDSIALAPFTQRICHLDEGDWIVVKKNNFQIFNKDNIKVKRKVSLTSYAGVGTSKGNFNHFMQKEIYEQPSVLGDSLSRFIDPVKKRIEISGLKIDWKNINSVNLIACGSSYFACITATYWLQKIAKISCSVEFASEFRYKEIVSSENQLAIFISQSGETADTLAALRYAKLKKMQILSIVNVFESSIARESDYVIQTAVGPEIGVASTKALTAQLSVLACLSIWIGKSKNVVNKLSENKYLTSLIEVPSKITEILKIDMEIKKISKKIKDSESCIFLGRGACYPIALEGALKLKEISYIHAEGYASGEMKHGPIALIDNDMPVIIILPKDSLFEKNLSNTHEILARGGNVILITDEVGAKAIDDLKVEKIIIPESDEFVSPILNCIPVQLIAYFAAVYKGTDVDQPRNLAKSVTVE
mgnify:CR=1 FL=1